MAGKRKTNRKPGRSGRIALCSFLALLAAFIGNLPVEVEDIPYTFMEYLESFDHTLPQSMMPFGMLQVCDLDDIIKYTDVKIIK